MEQNKEIVKSKKEDQAVGKEWVLIDGRSLEKPSTQLRKREGYATFATFATFATISTISTALRPFSLLYFKRAEPLSLVPRAIKVHSFRLSIGPEVTHQVKLVSDRMEISFAAHVPVERRKTRHPSNLDRI